MFDISGSTPVWAQYIYILDFKDTKTYMYYVLLYIYFISCFHHAFFILGTLYCIMSFELGITNYLALLIIYVMIILLLIFILVLLIISVIFITTMFACVIK